MNEQELDKLFLALGSRTRRRILDIVRDNPGIPVGQLAAQFDVSRIAVMKHLAQLQEANLILSEQDGRSRRLYFNAVPIQQIHERWTDEYSGFWAGQLSQLKFLAEKRHNKDGSKQ